MAVYGYVRVPARRTEGERNSTEYQIRSIVRYAMRRGWSLSQVFPEWEISCGERFEDRPQGKNLLSAAKEGDVVIGCHLEHMFRSAAEVLPVLNHFRQRKAALILLDLGWEITQGDLADRVFTILGAVARIEAAQTRDRAPKIAPIRDGAEYLGGAAQPFGFAAEKSRTLAPVQREQDALQEIAILRACGFSYERISQALKRKGFFFSPEAVQRLSHSRRAVPAAT